jgi:multidrug resistance efflux pump
MAVVLDQVLVMTHFKEAQTARMAHGQTVRLGHRAADPGHLTFGIPG